jgi:hypothetical protein
MVAHRAGTILRPGGKSRVVTETIFLPEILVREVDNQCAAYRI